MRRGPLELGDRFGPEDEVVPALGLEHQPVLPSRSRISSAPGSTAEMDARPRLLPYEKRREFAGEDSDLDAERAEQADADQSAARDRGVRVAQACRECYHRSGRPSLVARTFAPSRTVCGELERQ